MKQEYNEITHFNINNTKYSIKEFASPVWEGNVVYAEPAFVREISLTDSSVAPISLLYPIDEVISLRSSDQETVYKEGVDYKIVDGKIVVIPASEGGRIKVLPYYSADSSIEAFTYSSVGKHTADYMKKGDYYYYWSDPMYNGDKEGGVAKWMLSITYKHSGKSVITPPANQSKKLAGFISKLTEGNSIHVVSLGDSITEGCSASKNHQAGPWGFEAPAYNQMFCDYLEAAYGVNVNHTNFAVGGKNSTWGTEDEQLNNVCQAKPDLFILAFGMNDGGMSPEQHSGNIKAIIDAVLNKCPDAYAIVVSTCLLGQGYSSSNQNRPKFGNALAEIFENTANVVVANVTNIDLAMQGYDTIEEKYHKGPKVYQDLTGSNSNHPNDFMHRIYLQTMIASALGKNKFSF